MAIGIVSDTEFQEELNKIGGVLPPKKKEQVIEGEIIEKEIPGRKENDVNVPNSLRSLLGITALEEGRESALELAESFDISPSSVSAYSHGNTSTKSYDNPEQGIKKAINKARERAINKAHSTLDKTLDELGREDKLKDVKARELAGIAKDMSAIIKNLEPEKENESEANAPRFVVFAPSFIKEEKFETIVVNE